jgi:lipopolysaccharide export system permease protein
MDLLGRYIFRQTALALAMILITLTALMWVGTVLKYAPMLSSSSDGLVIFFKVTMLSLPNLISFIAPVALFVASIHTLNRLNTDSELIIIAAAGGTIWRVMKPFLLLAALVSGYVLASSAYLQPLSMQLLRNYVQQMRSDFISQVLEPGVFRPMENGLTFHIRERLPDGEMLGLIVQDEHDPKQTSTYLAERAQIFKSKGDPDTNADDQVFLVMNTGQIHRMDPKTNEVQIITFERYLFDISELGGAKPGAAPPYKASERYLIDLLYPDWNDPNVRSNTGKIRGELHDMLAAPLYPIFFVLLAVIYLGQAQTTREGRGNFVVGAFAIGALARAGGIAAKNLLFKQAWAIILVYGIPGIGIVMLLLMAFYNRKPVVASFGSLSLLRLRFWKREVADQHTQNASHVSTSAPHTVGKSSASGLERLMGTLGVYISKRFLFAIFAVFMLCFWLVFLGDFIERLRQASGKSDVPMSTLLLLVMLRTPAFLEMILPFTVLIGSIGAFLMLSRSSELVILRAAGMSVWQFIKPGLIVAAILGGLATAVYNPLSALAKDYGDQLTARIFPDQKSLMQVSGAGTWLRQDGVDGPSVLHFRVALDKGASLAGVTVLQFDSNNKFIERIEGKKATLRQGFWELENANVASPGIEARRYGQYISSTYLKPAQASQSIRSPESISFWELPDFIDFIEKSGLSATQYRLYQQLLLARPLLMATMVLVAATCALRPFRFGRIQTMVIAGLTAGFAFFIFGEMSRQLGATGFISMWVAAWAPGAIAGFLALTVLLHQEDG